MKVNIASEQDLSGSGRLAACRLKIRDKEGKNSNPGVHQKLSVKNDLVIAYR